MERWMFGSKEYLSPEPPQPQSTYHSESRSNGLDIHSINAFMEDTYAELSEEEIKEVMDRIEVEAKDINMGTTTEKALNECSVFLKQKGIETGDPSRALDISTLRILKMMPGIYDLKFEPNEEINQTRNCLLLDLIDAYIIPDEEEFLRYKVIGSEGETTLDQHMRIHGAARNTQRHITKKEMGVVLAYVRDIIRGYLY